MRKYVNVYDFDVVNHIKEGYTVCALDRENNEVYIVNDMPVSSFVELQMQCGKENRVIFWVEENTEETEE